MRLLSIYINPIGFHTNIYLSSRFRASAKVLRSKVSLSTSPLSSSALFFDPVLYHHRLCSLLAFPFPVLAQLTFIPPHLFPL